MVMQLKKNIINYRNSIWPRVLDYGDAAVTQQCIYASETVRHCLVLGTRAHVASLV